MRSLTTNRSIGFALLATVSFLALLSILAVTLVGTTQVDRSLAMNFVLHTRAQLAAESGIDRAIALLRNMPGGPANDTYWDAFAAPEPPADTLGGYVHELRVSDESGKLNLNDPNPESAVEPGRGRLEIVTGILFGLLLNDNARGDGVAATLFRDPQFGRQALAGDQFASVKNLENALQAAKLSPIETRLLLDNITILSWRDEAVIRTHARVHGQPDSNGFYPGADLIDMLDKPIDRWSEFQTREFKLEPRSPVNLNTASRELLQALIQPLQGAFLEEGPAENQSSEHYGWWSAGDAAGERDPNVNKFGVIRRTPPLTAEQAALLAQAMHDRIHGIANSEMLMPDQQDANDPDGNGAVAPNPFETWEEFRDFLERGICGAPALDEGSPAYRIFVGMGFEYDPATHIPRPYTATCVWRDPQTGIPDPTGVQDFSNRWRTGVNLGAFWQPAFREVPVINPWANVSGLEARITRWCNRYYAGFVRDMIFANFNPNSLFNDWNPNANMFLGVDKAQLLQSTTEGCFASTGVFYIESQGQVTTAEGDILAAQRVICDIQMLAPLRLTSQADFLEDLRIEDPAANLAQYASAATNPSSSSRFGWAHTSPNGRLGLQFYPEPLFPGADGRLAVPPSRFDGYWMLAETEVNAYRDGTVHITAMGDFNGNDANPLDLDGVRLRAGDFSGGPCPEAIPDHHHIGKNRPMAAALTPATPGGAPGTLYPDGAYSETGRVIGYKLGNINTTATLNINRAMQGGVLFWMKPNFHPGISTRIRKLFTGPSRPGVYCPQQFAALYYLSNPCSSEEDGTDGFFSSFWVPADYQFAMRAILVSSSISYGTADGGLYGKLRRNYWTPTRSLAFGTAWQDGAVSGANYRQFMLCDTVSCSLTRDNPTYDAAQVPTRPLIQPQQHALQAHGWMHITVSWQLHSGSASADGVDNRKKQMLWINGDLLPYVRVNTTDRLYRRESFNPYLVNQNPTQSFVSENLNAEWFRFGELPAGGSGPGFASPAASPYAADSTIDNVVCCWGGNPNINPLADSATAPRTRYYNLAQNGQAGIQSCLAAYTSPRISLNRVLENGGARLHSAAWTLYRPQHNVASYGGPSSPAGIKDNISGLIVNRNDPVDPCGDYWASDITNYPRETMRQWDFLSVDFKTTAGNWNFGDFGQWNKRLTYAGGSEGSDTAIARYSATDTFQFRAGIHLQSGQSLTESPVIDDFTFTFMLDNPRILRWEVMQ